VCFLVIIVAITVTATIAITSINCLKNVIIEQPIYISFGRVSCLTFPFLIWR